MNRVLFRGLFFFISAVLAISCGGNSSLSPTAPSQTGAANRSGAMIVGQVSGASAPITTRSTVSTLAMSSVTVKVVGTNVSTTTDGQGQFTLTGVPPGEVRLEFTGPGGSATISISGVKIDDEIHITVTLNGSNARVDSEHRSSHGDGKQDQGDGKQDQNELKGAISGLTGTCPAISFTVQNTKVTTTANTAFEDVECASLKNGTVVEIKGTRGSDGSIAATKVEGDD